MDRSRVESKLGFDRIREAVADRCATDYAASRVMEEQFCTDAREIRKRLVLTDEMRLILMFEDSFPTSGYIDALPFLEAIGKGSSIDERSVAKLRTLLDTLRKISSFFRSIKDGVYPNLKRASSSVAAFPEILRRIEDILDRSGTIKDSASEELAKIRKSLSDKEKEVSRRMTAILRKAQADGITDADAAVSVRDGKMLIPVSSAKKRSLPGFIYDESSSGRTTFIEPAEIVQLNNDISELRFAEAREKARILDAFADFIRPRSEELCIAAAFIGETDFIMAKASTSLDMRAGMPIISTDGSLSLRKARHPLLEKSLRKEGREIVPVTVTLTPAKHILLVSGPNAGGKSVCLKTTGLLQYMFQWGMLIPTSESSELPVFNNIMVSIGDDQSLDDDLSTYSSFLADMKAMLSEADSRALILIDEFGSGTEPSAGGAIAEAILSAFDAKGAYGVITTHYTNLKLYASGEDTGVVNGAMLFDSRNIEPLFKLEIGLPGNSFAFALARKMGLPEDIVRDAELKAGGELVGMERNLRQIARSRRVLDEKLQRIKATDKTLESITGKYQKELEDIRQTRKDILDEARQQAEDIIKGANRQVEKTIRTIKEAQAEKEATKAAREDLQQFVTAIGQKKTKDEKDKGEYLERKLQLLQHRQQKEMERKKRRGEAVETPSGDSSAALSFRKGPLKAGEKVRIKSNGMVGEVTKISSKDVTVAVGNISTTLSPSKVERISSNEYKAAVKDIAVPRQQVIDSGITERKLAFSPELDVRGQRVMEALENVVRYIDDALMLNVSSVRIIHGKGTGALREEIQKYLRTVPGVESVTDEDIRLGGSGVTIVRIG